jgi:hypothetical protein
MNQKSTVFIHTNDKQIVGAYVGMYSMKQASAHPDAFDVKLIRLEETPHLLQRQGQKYLRKGKKAVWLNEDLQSFSPLRRMVPQLMGFQGRAVVTDPDVFAMGDINELLTIDMKGKAILCRHVSDGYKGNGHRFYASSVMLLDCAKLTHWRWNDDIDRMFSGDLDYGPWIGLTTEDPDTIGEIGEEWNSFDKLTPSTRLLHTTERLTQPWKTGLPIDFDLNTKAAASAPAKPPAPLPDVQSGGWLDKIQRAFGIAAPKEAAPDVPRYQPHPDKAQERKFIELLKGAIEGGYLDESTLRRCVADKDVRGDVFDLLKASGLRLSHP